MLSQTEQNEAMSIARFVITNGRVEKDNDGELNSESLRVEVSFEATERGYADEDAELMGEYASAHT